MFHYLYFKNAYIIVNKLAHSLKYDITTVEIHDYCNNRKCILLVTFISMNIILISEKRGITFHENEGIVGIDDNAKKYTNQKKEHMRAKYISWNWCACRDG